MFGKKKEPAPRKGGGKALMAQMGMSDMDDMEAMVYGDLENDVELEAELAMLAGGSPTHKNKRAAGMAHIADLDQMIARSLQDVPSDDEEVTEDDESELMAELQELTTGDDEYEPPAKSPSPRPPQDSGNGALAVLQERHHMYKLAQDNAKAAGETSKARRMDRGIKNIEDLIKRAKSGRPIAEDDIPPPVAVTISKSNEPSPHTEQSPPPTIQEPERRVAPVPAPRRTTPPAPSPPREPERQPPSPIHQTGPPPTDTVAASLSPQDAEKYVLLKGRRDQYKTAALNAKHGNDMSTAKKFMITAKQFDTVLKALEEGKPIDLSQMPPPPPGFSDGPKRQREVMQGLAVAAAGTASSRSQATAPAPVQEEEPPELTQEDKVKLFHAPEAAGSVMEALLQRLDKYKSSSEAARAEGNSSKARRMGRIVKQYEDAIKLTKAGKPVDFEELPTPPGFPPIPVGKSPTKSPAPPPAAKQAAPGPPNQPQSQGQRKAAAPSPPQKVSPGGLVRQNSMDTGSILSRAEQQAMFLQERQLQFKKAALEAKNNGDIELAKSHLRKAMGLNQMIEAAHSGLPVNLSEVPPPPGAKEDFELISDMDVAASKDAVSGDRNEMYKKLEQDLINQIRISDSNANHYTQLGDVSSASKFNKLSENSRKDLDALKNAFKHGDPVPRFHYETRTFSIVQSCSDLGDDVLEINIIRGIHYGLPKDYSPTDLTTYIKFEFPYPNDSPQAGYSDSAKSTNCPEYDQKFTVNVARKSRAFLRLLKSKAIKFEIYYKRGFLKSDKLLATASVKLQSLENKCILHESYDLMDGRKSVGGKLEIKIRIRDPFISKQVEETKEKWLVFDLFERSLQPKRPELTGRSATTTTSMEVLKYEKQLLDQKIQNLGTRISQSEKDALIARSLALAKQVEQQRAELSKGGVPSVNAYLNKIMQTRDTYLEQAKAQVAAGRKDQAQIYLNKKKLVEKEVEAIRSKLASRS